MAEFSFGVRQHRSTKVGSFALLGLLAFSIILTAMSGSFESRQPSASASAISLTLEPVAEERVGLGSLASRTQCKPMSHQGNGPYTMSGTDSRTGDAYSFQTDVNYSGPQRNEARESSTVISYDHNPSANPPGVLSTRTGVLELSSTGNIASFGNTCDGRSVYGSAFGPQVYTAAFQATAGQVLSFDWAAAGGGDDYEVYAFLVKVPNSSSLGDASTTTLLAHGRGRTQGWTTSTGTIPSDGYYRFRFVNGTYDASGYLGVGAKMYIDPRKLFVGDANNISFAPLNDMVRSASAQTFTVSASATSSAVVAFTSSTSSVCTVGSSSHSNGVSTATVTVPSNAAGLCTISANSAATGSYATAATVTRSFTVHPSAIAPQHYGGTVVSGTAAVGQTLTAVEGSWGDGGSPITSTTYRWQSCLNSSCSWADVPGATDSTIVLGSSDVGRKFRFFITKTNSATPTNSTQVQSSESGVVAKGTQAALSISTTTATYGQPLTLQSAGGSGSGAVTFSVVSGTCALNGTTLTPGVVGSACVVKASKAGDAAYNPAESVNTTITIAKGTQAAVTMNGASGTFGSTTTLSATGGSGDGAFSYSVVSGPCTVSGATLTPTGAGTCVVRATKAADANYNSRDSADASIAIAKGSQTTAISVSTSSATYGTDETLTASGGNGSGAVSFAKVSGPCTVSGATLTPTGVGTCVVTATRAADNDYNALTSTHSSITIARRQVTFVVSATDRAYNGTRDIDLTIGSLTNVVSGDDVEVDTSKITGTVANGDPGANKLVTLAFASGVLTGSDASKYTYATPSNPRVDITKANQTGFALTNSASFVVGTPLQLQSSGGQSGGAISYSVTSGVCTVSGTQLSATRGGITCVVTATRQGDSRYNNATATLTVTVNKAPQQLTFRTSAPAPALVGATYAVSVTSDAFLAPTIVIANSSSSVCSIAADVVTFNTPGACLISASQSGTDVYLAAAASQSVTVEAAPVSTTAPSTIQTETPASVAPTASTTPTTVTTPSTAPSTTTPRQATTTTTTTTLPPNQGDPTQPMTDETGALPDLDAGVVSAIVRGEKVEVTVTTGENGVTMRLPNDVEVGVVATDRDGNPLPVTADGSVSAYRRGTVRVQMDGLVPGTTYTAYLFSTPVELGRGIVGPDGRVDEVFEMPEEIEQGGHTLQVNGVGPNSEVVSLSMGIEVIEREDNTVLTTTVIILAILGALFIPLQRRRRLFRRA